MFKAKEIKIDAGQCTVVLNEKDAKDIGLRSLERVKVIKEGKSLTALVETTDSLVSENNLGVLCKAFKELKLEEDDEVQILPVERPRSIDFIKKKLDGKTLSASEIRQIVTDIVNHNLSDIEVTAYITSIYLQGLNMEETLSLINAMVESGEVIEFDKHPIYDFHSIGGVPGNKITLLVVPIIAAADLTIPKTSSRAISSACGTADIFEVLANVTLKKEEIKRIAETVGGTIAWGGSVNLAPADDLIIRVEYPLSIDPYSQIIASIMAKKKAVTTDYFLLDIPTGPNTKVPKVEEAKRYARDFIDIGRKLNMQVECAITYGGQPIGLGIGPAIEAKEALECLEGKDGSSTSVIGKSISMAGIMFDMAGVTHRNGKDYAREILDSGKALEKLREIIEAQGGDPNVKSEDVEIGKFKEEILSRFEGYVTHVHNKKIFTLARAAGSPKDKGAGLILNKKRGDKVDKGEVLLTLYADNEAKLKRAKSLANKINALTIEGMVLEHIPGRPGIVDFSGTEK